MALPIAEPTRPLARELAVFVVAVFVGSLSGILTGELVARWAAATTATNAALAVATTCTGATHARLAHRQPLRSLLPRIAVAAPLAYGVMRLVHVLLAA
jgi:putative effector of murein hydrolase